MSWGLIDKTLEGRQKVYFPHWFRGEIPSGIKANLQFRKRMRTLTNAREIRELRRKCKEDFLFYCQGFIWLFKATGDPKPVPFVPYDFQIEAFTVLWKCLHDGQEDCRIKKPRDVGATWMIVSLFEHGWHFMRNLHFLLGSRKEDELDGAAKDASGASPAGEWSKLLPKVDFIHLNQPSWLWPRGYKPRVEPHRRRLRIFNPELGCLITGESANPRFGRSGRYYAIGFDEHAHTDHAYEIIGSCSLTSECHIWWSSPDGPDTAHAMLGRAPIRQVSIEWWMHPLHSKDMKVDPITLKRTSPWFELRSAQMGYDQRMINNELLADETRSAGGYYSDQVFDRINGVGNAPGTIRDPIMRGELDIIPTPDGPVVKRFCDQSNGRWLFWLNLMANGCPTRETRYIIGIDVAAGTVDTSGRGASNSVISVCNWKTGEIVAEFATHGTLPLELAEIANAVGWWFQGEDFGPALIIPEANGPGQVFLNALVNKLKYPNVYVRDVAINKKKTSKAAYGWYNGPPEGALGFGSHVMNILEGKLIERSKDCAEEMRHYNHNPNGKGAPIHAASTMSEDPSGARDNHGDRVISRVCICVGLDKWHKEAPQRIDEPPRGSLAWFQERKERAALEVEEV